MIQSSRLEPRSVERNTMAPPVDASAAVDRDALIAWYQRNRERSRALFDLLTENAYYDKPIALRHPIVFYEGHLPAFSFNTLVKKAARGPSIDRELEALFARGIDPDEAWSRQHGHASPWPERSVVQQFAAEADRRVLEVLESEDLDRTPDPLNDRGNAAFTILEHEAMHQETLLYMWHRLPFDQKRQPAEEALVLDTDGPAPHWIEVDPGSATLGVDPYAIPFGWDNEFPSRTARVDTFEIQQHDVTNGQYLEFIDAGGYDDERWWGREDWEWLRTEGVSHPLFWERRDDAWFWRGMFRLIPLPQAWPVYVSHAEAAAYARWRG